jgi:flagellar M-ring protein FliF
MAEPAHPPVPVAIQQLNSPYVRQGIGLMLAVATAAALLVGAWLWSQAPDYRVLYANVSDRDGGEIVAALSQMNVPYRVADGGGAILVPSDQVHDIRLQLASEGLPRGSSVGFELMENTRLGTSQFLEQVNYQRALQGELARSIKSIAAVRNARVHLAIPKPSVFLRETQKPSASVLVDLFPGRQIETGQVSSIAHLVSSSVPNLPLTNVTVVDQTGKLLSANDADDGSALDPRQLKYTKQIEQSIVKRIETILEPFVGAENVRAQVTADVDFSQIEAAEELYRPNQQSEAAVRSSQSQESMRTEAGQSGVPGAFSNQPPDRAEAPIETTSTGDDETGAEDDEDNQPTPQPVSSNKDSRVLYEVDKTVRHTRQSVGTVKRLSVAVVVNHKRVVGGEGNFTLVPRTTEEMTQITDLVRQSMGFSEARGDAVSVANAAFTSAEIPEAEALPLWRQPGTIALVKDIAKHLLIAAVALFAFFKILRPMFQRALAPIEIAVPAQLGAPGGEHDETVGLLTGAQQGAQVTGYGNRLESAKQLAREEPKLVANVVKGWVDGS